MADFDAIYLSLNDKPAAILRGMDEILARRDQSQQTVQRRRLIPLWLFLAGFPFLLIDLLFTLFGYTMCLFSFVALVCWIAAGVVFISNRRSQQPKLSPGFMTARQVLYTLRDDVDPRRTFFGHLDLTGTQKPEKVAREAANALGLVTQVYRDEWLSLKTRLCDGNILRLSMVQRDKIRKGYWKRSRVSGKNKFKPPKPKGSLQELNVRITINPQIYESYVLHSVREGMRIGAYTIEQVRAGEGSLSLVANSMDHQVNADDLLAVLRNTYDMLKRKA